MFNKFSLSALIFFLMITCVHTPAYAAEKKKAKPAPKAIKKVDAPPEEDIEKTKGELREIFEKEYKDEENFSELSERLYQQSREAGKNTAIRYVALQESGLIAAKCANLNYITRAVTEMDKYFHVESVVVKYGFLCEVDVPSKDTALNAAVAGQFLVLKDEAVLIDNFEIAGKALDKAGKFAKKSKDKLFTADMKEHAKKFSSLKKLYSRLNSAIKKLESNPEDPKANKTVGEYFCYAKNEWDQGIHYFVKCGNEKYMSAAALEMTNPKEPEKQIAVADLWWDISKKEKSHRAKKMQKIRAGYWYELALPKLEGLVKTKASKRLTDVHGMSLYIEFNGVLQRLNDQKFWKEFSHSGQNPTKPQFGQNPYTVKIEKAPREGYGGINYILPKDKIIVEISATITQEKRERIGSFGLLFSRRGVAGGNFSLCHLKELRGSNVGTPVVLLHEPDTPHRLRLRMHVGTLRNPEPTYSFYLDGKKYYTFEARLKHVGFGLYNSAIKIENVRMRLK